MEKLPDGAEMIDVSLAGDGYILLDGEFDFRKLAKLERAAVCADSFTGISGTKYVYLTANLFGCEVIYSLVPGLHKYEEELRRCKNQ